MAERSPKIKPKGLEYSTVISAVPKPNSFLNLIGMKDMVQTMRCILIGAFSQLTKTRMNKNVLGRMNPIFTKYTKITMISTTIDSSTHCSLLHG